MNKRLQEILDDQNDRAFSSVLYLTNVLPSPAVSAPAFAEITRVTRDPNLGTVKVDVAQPIPDSELSNVEFMLFLDRDQNGAAEATGVTSLSTNTVMYHDASVSFIGNWPVERSGSSVTITVPASLDSEEWVVASAYYPQPELAFRCSGGLPLLPITDVVTSRPDITFLLEIYASAPGLIPGLFQGKSSPVPAGAPKDGDGNGDGVNDWLLNVQVHGNLRVEEYSIDGGPAGPDLSDFFGKKVYQDLNGNGTQDPGEAGGFVGRCPYEGGDNTQIKRDVDGDGFLDVVWLSVDRGGQDDDNDGQRDAMLYWYDEATGQVTVTHLEDDQVQGTPQTMDPPADPSNLPAYGTSPGNP